VLRLAAAVRPGGYSMMYGGLNSGCRRGGPAIQRRLNYIGFGQASGQAFGKASSKGLGKDVLVVVDNPVLLDAWKAVNNAVSFS